MTKQEELIQLALSKEIGFESEMMYNHPLAYSVKEETRYYLWLCELTKYLCKKYNCTILIDANEISSLEEDLIKHMKRILKK